MVVECAGTLADLLQIPQGDQQLVVIHVQGGIRLHAHGCQVDRPQTQLGENTGENGGNAALGMEKAGDQTGKTAGDECAQHGNPEAPAVYDHHNTDHTAGTEGAVHRQIGKVQNPVGDVQPDCHDAPDQSLRDSTGQRIDETRHWLFLR